MKVVFLPPKSRSKQVKHHFRDVSLVKLRNLCSGPMQVSLRLSGLKMSQGWEQPQDSGFKRLFLQTLTEEYSNSMMSMYYYIQRCSYNLWMARLIAPHYEGIVDTQLYRFFGSWDEGIHYYKRLHANIYIYIYTITGFPSRSTFWLLFFTETSLQSRVMSWESSGG